MMDFLTLIIPLGFIAFFALMVYWVIQSQRKEIQTKRQRAAQLGLKPLEKPDPSLLERISRLRQTPQSEQAALKNIFTQRMPDGDLYVFDMESNSGNDSSSVTENMVMVVSSTLNLPRFGIFPKLGSSLGIMGKYLEKIISWMMKRSNLVIVPVEGSRLFTERYLLLGESPERVQDLIASALLEQIAAVENQHIEAEGDAFAFSNLIFARQPARSQEESLPALIDQAQRVFNILQGYRRSSSP